MIFIVIQCIFFMFRILLNQFISLANQLFLQYPVACAVFLCITMYAVWHGDVNQLTNHLQQSMNLRSGRQFNIDEIIPYRFQNTHLLWTNCLIGTFAEPVERNCWDVKNALLYQWEIHGGLSVRKASQWVFIIRFQHDYEMQRVLSLATRRVFGDLFCIKEWEASDNLQDWFPTLEMFFITISNLSPAQVTSENLRRYLACMGEIMSFSYPVRKQNGSFSITVRAKIRFRQSLRFQVNAENELGYINPIYFEFHNFPFNFCEFCNLIGHKMVNCLQADLAQHQAEVNQMQEDAVLLAMQQADLAQHQAEVNQMHADAALLAMQQEVVLQQEHMQPMMVQDNMELSEDSLSSSVEQAATEVTCNDYISQLEEDKENHEDQVVPNLSAHSIGNVGPKLDSYMWKVIQKRERPGNLFKSAVNSWGEGSSSQHQQHNTVNEAYMRNWNMMQSFFHWDLPLPVPKRPRIDGLELSLAPPNPSQVVIREIDENESENTLKNYPHQ